MLGHAELSFEDYLDLRLKASRVSKDEAEQVKELVLAHMVGMTGNRAKDEV